MVRLWDVESGELLMTIPTKCNPLKKLQLVEAIDDRRVHEMLKQQSQKYYNSEESLTSDFSSATTTGDKANSKMASSSSTFLLLSKRVARERDEHGNIIRTMDRVNSMRQKFRESRMSINENYEENYDNEYRENVDEDDDMDDEFNTYKDVDTYFQTLDLETYSARIDEISCVPEQNILQPLEGQGITDKRAGKRMPKYNIWLYKESSKQFYPRFSMFCSRIRHCRKIYGISIHSYSVVNFRM